MSAHHVQDRQREAARQAEEDARARRLQQARIAAVTVVLIVVAGAIGLTVAGRGATPSVRTAPTGELLRTDPPWAPQAVGLSERLAPFNFPPPGDESYHAHVLLSVFRDGRPVAVPAGIGFDDRGSHSSLHTHTPDGVIHMEADDPYPYELGQVFVAWGVAMDDERLGPDVATATKSMHVYVNGEPAPDRSRLVLKDGDNVVVAYGEEGSFPTEPDASVLNGA
jgi:hypothetical protein